MGNLSHELSDMRHSFPVDWVLKHFRQCASHMPLTFLCHFIFKMLRVVGGLFFISFASCSLQRVPRLSDPLAVGGLGWELKELAVQDYVKGSVWPKPQQLTQTDGVAFSLDPTKFKFASVGQSSDVLTAALSRYEKLTFPDGAVSSKVHVKLDEVTTLRVEVIDKYEDQSLDSDESCKFCSDQLFFNSYYLIMYLLVSESGDWRIIFCFFQENYFKNYHHYRIFTPNIDSRKFVFAGSTCA